MATPARAAMSAMRVSANGVSANTRLAASTRVARVRRPRAVSSRPPAAWPARCSAGAGLGPGSTWVATAQTLVGTPVDGARDRPGQRTIVTNALRFCYRPRRRHPPLREGCWTSAARSPVAGSLPSPYSPSPCPPLPPGRIRARRRRPSPTPTSGPPASSGSSTSTCWWPPTRRPSPRPSATSAWTSPTSSRPTPPPRTPWPPPTRPWPTRTPRSPRRSSSSRRRRRPATRWSSTPSSRPRATTPSRCCRPRA